MNNFALAASPEKWMELYAGAPGGDRLVHGDRTIHARLTLFLAGSFSVAGLALIWRGVYFDKWGIVEAGRASRRLGFGALLVTPVLWVVGAAGWYATQSDGIRAVFSGTPAAWLLLILWVTGGLVMIVFAHKARQSAGLFYPLVASLGMFLVTACMVVLRDLQRIVQLAPAWDSSMVDVRAQWVMFTLFVVSLAVGLALIIGMLAKSLPGMAAAARARAEEIAAPTAYDIQD